ncbi:MAG: hypothetical protein A2Y10_09760 [Planctomycetes bacterium GWF2_41_51]|nr:MAG: hypothetical protein A2Y10_09760 [Planctomycetes bacterium GWF2_41_51]
MNNFVEINPGCYIRSDFVDCFNKLNLESIDAVFEFEKGKNLAKANLASFRQRIMFETENPKSILFLKRYQNIPKLTQFKNWLNQRKRISVMACDLEPGIKLQQAGINTPQVIAYGERWNGLFEKQSFIITEKIPNASSLEEKLPEIFFSGKNQFIKNLAEFVRKFHDTGFRHRDLYLCHIFSDSHGNFTLIDLNRAFKPLCFSKKYLIKDLAQLYYSSPGDTITKTDRLRFFLYYFQKEKLTKSDRSIVKKIKLKAERMAKHDKKHNRTAPFEMKQNESR